MLHSIYIEFGDGSALWSKDLEDWQIDAVTDVLIKMDCKFDIKA